MGPVLISSTGSPDPLTSYSNCMPLTFAFSIPLWRNERRYGGNFCRYNGRPMSQDPAREAVARGEWQQAYDLLVEADARSPLSGPDLALLADVAYAAGHLDVTIASWERAYAQSMGAGDRLAAAGAAVQVAMHLLFDTALMAPVRGWARRCEQLLEGTDETPVHAWLAVVRNYERLLSGDFEKRGSGPAAPSRSARSARRPRPPSAGSPRPAA